MNEHFDLILSGKTKSNKKRFASLTKVNEVDLPFFRYWDFDYGTWQLKFSDHTDLFFSKTHNKKASPATPGFSKSSRGVAKSDTDSASLQKNPRLLVDQSPKLDTPKLVVNWRSLKLNTTPDSQYLVAIEQLGTDLLSSLLLTSQWAWQLNCDYQ
ncbi:WEB family protein [Forsythia ovata]|uniref:WEB family protein n=1 Tax=Forsythia ovata TaxID=205694 RepID=A0ABD1WSN7_9LAMI